MNRKLGFYSLYLIAAIDSIGIGIIFPVLALLFSKTSTLLLPAYISEYERNLYYGLTIFAYPFFMFLSNQQLGAWSDKFGRKILLAICLLGTSLSYAGSLFAISFHSASLFIISRMIAGFFAGTFPVLQAAIIDGSNNTTKDKNLNILFSFSSLGFILGPLIGGIFPDIPFKYFDPTYAPFIFVSLLSLANYFLLMIYFYNPQPENNSNKDNISLITSFFGIYRLFRSKSLQRLTWSFLLMQIAWSIFYQYISLFLSYDYHFSSNKIGLFMGCMGFGFVFGTRFISMHYNKLFTTKRTFSTVSMIIITCLVITLTFHPANILVWIAGFGIASLITATYAIMISIFSDLSDKDHLGTTLGSANSLVALCWAFSGIGAAFLINIHVTLPFILASFCFFISTLYISRFKESKAQ